MRMSDAIMLGSMMLKPFAGCRDNGLGGGCALGMADVAAGGHYFCESTYPWINNTKIGLPCGCTGTVMGGPGNYPYYSFGDELVSQAIIHLFNYHVMTKKDWTLEQLVDWVRSVDPKEEEEKVNETVVMEPIGQLVSASHRL